MTPDRIRAMRALCAELRSLTMLGEHATDAQVERWGRLSGALTASVPELLDELEQCQARVERLIAEREDGGRPRIMTFAKLDSRGGNA